MPPIDGVSNLGVSLGLDPRTPSGAAQAQTGMLRGEQVRVADDPQSILADAAEELSQAHQDKGEAKRLEDREVATDTGDAILKIEEINLYLEAMHRSDDRAKLDATADRILQRKQDDLSPRQEARGQFADVSDQYAALQYALEKGKSSGTPAQVLAAIRDGLAELEEDHGERIRAGFNAVAGLHGYATDATSAEAFRDTYRDVVLGKEGLAATLDEVLQRHGLAEFPRVVPSLVRALGEDLQSLRPTRDAERLQATLRDLNNLEIALTVHDNARELSERLQREFTATGFDPLAMMKEVVGLTGERWVSGSRITGIAEGFGLRDPQPQIGFLTGAKAIVRDLPVRVFSDPDARLSLVNAVQDALDAAIDREEAGA